MITPDDVAEVYDLLGFTPSQARDLQRLLRRPTAPPARYGLERDESRDVLAAWEETMSVTEVAATLDLTPDSVRRVLRETLGSADE